MYSLQKTKTIGNNGMINLPKKWVAEFGFHLGELVEIRIQNREIWISHYQEETTENVRYITARQNVSIPSEIRNLLNLDKGNKLKLYVEPNEKSFVFIPIDKNGSS
ncbi:AbrB/MazE/SpoVT family DNA-binding domain-containing protein [Virgibacillus byunsanensis]|uniref:AbrB/MazE/SpoVT family DNA-binding domain-containing protein n=2 Tax=Virgibacillus byunsanensis TaxID=570945 RepID=A0ABW3LM92_9BACI